MSVDTPTYASWYGYHRLFQLDDRLAAIGYPVLMYKSVSIVVGYGNTCLSMLPPSVHDGVAVQWLRSLDDCHGRFRQLPDFVVDRIVAANDDYEGRILNMADSTVASW